MVPTVGEISDALQHSQLYGRVGKYSLINPSPLCVFFGGLFLAQAIDQILSRVDLRFFLPPSLPITLSSHLNQAISTLYPRPGSSFLELSISNSLFVSFSGQGTLHITSILSTYTYNPIYRDAEKREQDKKRTKKKERKKRASSCLPYSNQNIHTSYVHT